MQYGKNTNGEKFMRIVRYIKLMVLALVSCSLMANPGPIEQALVTYQDFPKPGVNFYDIGGLLKTPEAFKASIDQLTNHYQDKEIDVILALDARGFLFATPLAYNLGIPVVMLRKPGKLPGETISAKFVKEYGEDIVEMQIDALHKGQKVIIIDDLLATGGTLKAAIELARKGGAEVVEVTPIIELQEFAQTRNLDVPVYSLVQK